MQTRFNAALVALAATAALAIALVGMTVLDAPWLGFVAIVLLFASLIARQITIDGLRGFLITAVALVGVIAVALAAQRLI